MTGYQAQTKMYPIVKRTKTSLGKKIPDGYLGSLLYYCPICNKRLSGKKLNGNEWHARNNLKPIYCEGCGTLIHSFQSENEIHVVD